MSLTVESSYQLGQFLFPGEIFTYNFVYNGVLAGSQCDGAAGGQELQVPHTVTRVFEEADREQDVDTEQHNWLQVLACLLQTWLANACLSPVLFYVRLIKAFLLLFSLTNLNGWLTKSMEALINFALGNSFGVTPKFPLAR